MVTAFRALNPCLKSVHLPLKVLIVTCRSLKLSCESGHLGSKILVSQSVRDEIQYLGDSVKAKKTKDKSPSTRDCNGQV